LIGALTVAPVKRKLTDQQKRHFSIVGHNTASPILIGRLDKLEVEVYFNHHLFVEAETTYRQYFPSASVILRPRKWLKSYLVRSPGSWSSDIISLTQDWAGTFILEAMETGLTGCVRRNFRGYKLVPAREKLLVTRLQPLVSERKLLSNNGFTNVIISDDVDSCWRALSRELTRYIRDQICRLGKEEPV
jgi:hypothetical protein